MQKAHLKVEINGMGIRGGKAENLEKRGSDESI